MTRSAAKATAPTAPRNGIHGVTEIRIDARGMDTSSDMSTAPWALEKAAVL